MTRAWTAGTWGIGGPEFLWAYGTACAVAAIWAWHRWHTAVAAPRAGRDEGESQIGLYDLAMLGGGPQLAITTAATQLHRDGVLEVAAGNGTLRVAGKLDMTADPLEHAIVAVVAQAPDMTSDAMRAQVENGDAIRAMTDDLTGAGLLVDASQAARLRSLRLVFAGLAVVGIAGIAAGLLAGETIGWLAIMVLGVVCAAIALLRRPHATRRGREIVARWRAERQALRERPAAGDVALAAALFGGAALWLAEPAFASAIGVPRDEAETDTGRRGCSAGGGCSSFGGGCGGGCGGCG
ncbi:MAG: TIGR04222 domain-containing membrane protein [Actinobacteria bacterium]|nr:TIGR04222 domain-containing membrane protein [Actinomycetota bacterium]